MTQNEQGDNMAWMAWTGFILAFFLIQVVVWTIAVNFMIRNPSHAVVANYEENSLRWQELRDRKSASDALGWQVDLSVGDHEDLKQFRSLTIRVQDRDGDAVDGATVSTQAFHAGRASELYELEFTESGPGVYESTFQVRNLGKWQFDGTIKRDDSTRLIDSRIWVEGPKTSAARNLDHDRSQKALDEVGQNRKPAGESP